MTAPRPATTTPTRARAPEQRKEAASQWFQSLRDRMCAEFEKIEDELTGMGRDQPAGRIVTRHLSTQRALDHQLDQRRPEACAFWRLRRRPTLLAPARTSSQTSAAPAGSV